VIKRKKMKETIVEGIKGAIILVAEDNPFNWEITKTYIEMSDMQYQWARNGQEAYDLYTASPTGFDLILMDCQMPILDGYQASRKIREFEELQNEKNKGATTSEKEDATQQSAIRIVALTSHAMSGDHRKCVEAGMDSYLTKPISRKNLIQSIVRQLRELPKERRFQNIGNNADERKANYKMNAKSVSNSNSNTSNDHQYTNTNFDYPELIERLGNAEMAAKVIYKFVLYLPKTVKKMLAAYALRDIQMLGNAAHSLKGASGSVSAFKLTNVVIEINVVS